MKKTILFFILFTLLTVACVPQQGGRSSSSSTSSTKDPVATATAYDQGVNFIEHQSTEYTGTFSQYEDFEDTFYLKGNYISDYLSLEANQDIGCMVFSFDKSSTEVDLLIFAAIPKQYYDYTEKELHYFYLIQSADEDVSKTHCQGVELISELNDTYKVDGVTTVNYFYSVPSLGATLSGLSRSDSTSLFSKSGNILSKIQLGHLYLEVKLIVEGDSSVGTAGCNSNSDCLNLSSEYDCCLNNQCVKEGGIRPSIANDELFVNIIKPLVDANPSLYLDYPNYYYTCGTISTQPTPTATATTDPEQEEQDRLLKLKELRDCIVPDEEGFSICTKTISDVSSFSTDGYTAAIDDINFTKLDGNYLNTNITSISYDDTPVASDLYSESEQNDSLETAAKITFSTDVNKATRIAAILDSPQKTELKIKYKVDGSCTQINSTLARCSKTYTTVSDYSDPVLSTDHKPNYTGNTHKYFNIPSYADTTLTILVKVDGSLKYRTNDWTVSTGTDYHTISLNAPLYEGSGQKIEITYYTTGLEMLTSINEAREQIKEHCNCPSSWNCSLEPVYSEIDGVDTVVNYTCSYPENSTIEVPDLQTATVTGKTVPHRYFDTNGVARDEASGRVLDQEGTDANESNTYTRLFEYEDDNELKPNNLKKSGSSSLNYVGFNEIYGSFNGKNGSAEPAVMVNVKNNTYYDIFTNSGSYASCSSCGSDYFNSFKKLFPGSYTTAGGGYIPDWTETSRINNTSSYRADDLLFGRACFVPATMIPWSHVGTGNGSVKEQRQKRLAAQHFLFANGYQRDWYGFDYGALIGSFDGVTWFAIGNQRRIKTKSTKLFLALNTYMGDLNGNTAIDVTVSEANTSTANNIDHDTETDAAQCQKAHLCDTDQDCFRQLGSEYSCQTVTGIYTPWPLFSADADEALNDSTNMTIASLVGGLNGETKRCVYRGRGALCATTATYDKNNSITNATYLAPNNTNPAEGLISCASNSHCRSLTDSYTVFNYRISRMAASVVNQNDNTGTDADENAIYSTNGYTDEFGLKARTILRPFAYYGEVNTSQIVLGPKNVKTNVLTPLTSNNYVSAICIPGKRTDSETVSQMVLARGASPSWNPSEFSADEISNLGPTKNITTGSELYLYNACPAFGEDGDYLHFTSPSLASNNSLISRYQITQNVVSNLLRFHDGSSTADKTALGVATVNDSGVWRDKELNGHGTYTGPGISPNTCLRAPGASCFTDFDCGPSKFIASKISSLDDTTPVWERAFWEEEMICGHKYDKDSVLYDHTQNRCCRETGNTLTIYSNYYDGATQVKTDLTSYPGLNGRIDSPTRYSRINTAFDKMNDDTTMYPPLRGYKTNDNTVTLTTTGNHSDYQYNTLSAIATRSCCTGHYVRNFAESNGGGHYWTAAKLQTFNKTNFQCLNWMEQPSNQTVEWECQDDEVDVANQCGAISLSSEEREGYLDFFGRFELMGIPNVLIENDAYSKCKVDPEHQDLDGTGIFIPGTILSGATPETSTGEYSTLDATNFDEDEKGKRFKTVFDANKFSCCVPAGEEVPDDMADSKCCTGLKSNENSGGITRCCLNDYTDVTVYLNRYVSSEAKSLSESLFDPETGYIKSAATVQSFAVSKALCCSGQVATGRAISKVYIPGTTAISASPSTLVWKFVDSDSELNNDSDAGAPAKAFDKGVKWNNHVYCVPDGFLEVDETRQ